MHIYMNILIASNRYVIPSNFNSNFALWKNNLSCANDAANSDYCRLSRPNDKSEGYRLKYWNPTQTG